MNTYNRLSFVFPEGFGTVVVPLNLTEEPALGGGGRSGTGPPVEDPVAGLGLEVEACPSLFF